MKKLSAELLILAPALIFILALAVACPAPASATPPANTTSAVTNGQRIFAQSCASCHNAHNTTPKVGIGLQNYYRQHQPHPTDSSVRTIILKGKGAMPAFSTLSSSQTDDLISYLRTL